MRTKLLFALVVMVLLPSAALATDYSSTNFFVRDPTINQGGTANSTSTNFQLRGSIGERAQGRSTSSSFGLSAGFQYYDETGPTPGTVNDGTGADIDQQTDMTSLSANWSGFADPESGIARYEYRLRRTVDNQCWNAQSNAWVACDVWNNNGTATSFTLTHANLALRTGTSYITCVRAVNNANVTGTEACSDGVGITPSLAFGVDQVTVNLPLLSAANSWDGSATTTLSVTTNAYHGYTVYAVKTDLLRHVTNPSATIGDVADGGCNGSAVTWPGPTHFGFTSTDDIDGNKFNSGGTRYCAFPTSGSGNPGLGVADRTTVITGGQVSETHTITYRAQATANQTAGQYQTGIQYTVVARY